MMGPMRTATRKALEVADRERKLLDLALEIIDEGGFHNLNLGALAERSGYSKGTVYNHFTSREDLLIELSAESARRQLDKFDRLLALHWEPAQQLYGLALVYVGQARVNPVLFECSVLARTRSVQGRASEVRLTRRAQLETQLATAVRGAVAAACPAGERGALTPELSLDLVRSYLVGYSLLEVLAEEFRWSQKGDAGDELAGMVAVLGALGWPEITLKRLHAVKVVVDTLLAEGRPS